MDGEYSVIKNDVIKRFDCTNFYALCIFYLQIAPLMPTFRDLIFLAIDHNKQDIAYKLASLGADLNRKEKVCYQIVLNRAHKNKYREIMIIFLSIHFNIWFEMVLLVIHNVCFV